MLLWSHLTKLPEDTQGYAVLAELGGMAEEKMREQTRNHGLAFLAYTRWGDQTGGGQELANPDEPNLQNPTLFLSGVDIICRTLYQTWGHDAEQLNLSYLKDFFSLKWNPGERVDDNKRDELTE